MLDNVRRELEWGENVREVSRMPQQQDRQPCNDEAEDDDDDRVRRVGGDATRQG